jgi:hypothetical protein
MSRTEKVSLRLGTELLERIDELAGEEGRNRSNMIERLILRGLDGRGALPSFEVPRGGVEILPSEVAPKNASAEEAPPAHVHKRVGLMAGLDLCACGAVKGRDREWRLP